MSRSASHVGIRPYALAALAVSALATAALLGSPAIATAAEPAAAAPQTTVYYSFRDLATDQATHALYERIVSAARSVCPGYDSRDLADYAGSRQCQRQAVAHAIEQIGSARLAAVYTHTLPRRG
jgi:UrcA family protein